MKNSIYAWSCDLENFRGEGILAWHFVNELKKKVNNDIILESIGKKFLINKKKIIVIKNEKIDKLNFIYKYFFPFIGLVKCWKNYLQGKKVSYINYLPLWNFILFFFLPPKTILGPITGSYNYETKNFFEFFVRKIIFPVLFKLSSLAISKKKKLLFSTNLLKSGLNKTIVSKSIFNFALINLKKQRIFFKKKYDLLIYHRIHSNKSNFFLHRVANFLVSKKIKIIVIGDKMKIKGVTNKFNVNRKLALKIIRQSKFALNSGENPISLFATDCISNNIKIFLNKKTFSNSLIDFKENYYICDYENFQQSSNYIHKKILLYKKNVSSNKFDILKKKLIQELHKYFDIYN